MPKIAIGGPPHSGKTVLMGLLRALLPRDKFAVVEAAPDGEGITGWSAEAEQEIVRAVRRKGKFLEQFVSWACASVRNSQMPLTLVDLGGMLLDEAGKFTPHGVRVTAENERILRECDYLLVIANPSYAREAQIWADEGTRLGVKTLAILESVLVGADDEVFTAEIPLRARITRLDREHPPVGSTTARAVAQLMLLVADDAGTQLDGSEAADVNFPALAHELNLPIRGSGPDRDWFPSCLPELISAIQTATSDKPEIKLWGNCSAGFPYHSLACDSRGVSFYDPKVGSYVALPDVETVGEGNQLLNWRVENRDGCSFVEYAIPGQIFEVRSLPLVVPPAAQGSGVIVSGKGPWWLTGTIVRSYARSNASWVAVFTPQESVRTDVEGKKWSEKFPGLAPAIVVASSDSAVPVGTVIPFQLPK